MEPGQVFRPEAAHQLLGLAGLPLGQIQALLGQLIAPGHREAGDLLIGIAAQALQLLLGAEEAEKGLGRVLAHDGTQQGEIVAGGVQHAGDHLPAAGIGVSLRAGVGRAEVEVVVGQKFQHIGVEALVHRPGHPVLHGGADVDMGKAAEERLGQVVGRAGLAPVVAGGNDAGVGRQGPAVVHHPLQHDLEDDGLGLLGGVGKLIEKEDVQLAVLAQALQLHQPHGLDVDDLVPALVVDGPAVDGLGRLVHQLDVQDLGVQLLDAVALAVAGEAVEKDRDIRLDVGGDQTQLVVLLHAEGRVLRQRLRLRPAQLLQEVLVQPGRGLLPAQAAQQGRAAEQQAVYRIVVPAHRAQLQKHALPLAEHRPVRELDVAGGPALGGRQAKDLSTAQTVNRAVLSVQAQHPARLGETSLGVLFLCHVPQRRVQDRRGPGPKLRRGQIAAAADVFQLLLLPRLQQECRAQRRLGTVVEASEAVGAVAAAQIPVHAAAVHGKAVVHRGQQHQIRGRRHGAHRLKQGQRPVEDLLT